MGCILLILAMVAVGGCRRSAQSDAPVETSSTNVAPTTNGTIVSPANENLATQSPADVWKPDWPRRWHDAVDVVRTHARALELAMLAGAEDATENPDALIRAADRALAEGRAERAAERFAQAARLNPASADALMGQAIALISIGRYEQALPALEALLALSPDDVAVRFNYAVTLSQCGRHDQARAQYEALLDADATNLRARFNLASLLHTRNHLNEADKHYRLLLDDAARLAPADAAAAWASYAHLLLDLREPEAAMTAFAEAAKTQPNDAVAWLNLAAAAHAVGRHGTALAACQRAENLDPQDPDVRERLDELHRELRQTSDK